MIRSSVLKARNNGGGGDIKEEEARKVRREDMPLFVYWKLVSSELLSVKRE